MEKEEGTRKGPWTEQEDVQLVFYVNLFGDRRWDFIAKVSGLKVAGDRLYRQACLGHGCVIARGTKRVNCLITLCVGLKRTGKSCRLRWVNYLHPGLKRGKMTPHEERLVLELHSKWGNRFFPFIYNYCFLHVYLHMFFIDHQSVFFVFILVKKFSLQKAEKTMPSLNF